MFKKIVKMMLFVLVVSVFCNASGQVSYARKGGNKPNAQVTHIENGEKSDLPEKWKPNSELKEFNEDGGLKKIRKYGPDGRAVQDIDYEHGGPNHKFPHTHDWDWSAGDNNPNREDGVPLPGAKKLPPKKNNKKAGKGQKGARGQKSGRGQTEKIDPSKLSDTAKITAALGTAGTIAYFIISEGSRIVFPIRNLIPVL